jgi:signal transduction histidine kinase
LLSNAIKFSAKEGGSDDDGGIVSITIREGAARGEKNNQEIGRGEIVVNVRDNGEGIHPEILPRLFTKFATKSDTGGTGLGLYITKSIIEAHGGRIWADNNKDGKGATFSFTLPLSKKQEQLRTVDRTDGD